MRARARHGICAEVRAQLAGFSSLFLVGSEAQTQVHHGAQPALYPGSVCLPAYQMGIILEPYVYLILVCSPFAHFNFLELTK